MSKVVDLNGNPYRRRKKDRSNTSIAEALKHIDAFNKEGILDGVVFTLIFNDGRIGKSVASKETVSNLDVLGALDLVKQWYMVRYCGQDIKVYPQVNEPA